MRNTCILATLACGWVVVVGGWGSARAADDAADPAAPAPKSAAADGGLASEQRQVADRFRELEKLLLRMAELTAPTDPRRAALLRQAVAQSKQRDIGHQFDELVELLRQERLAVVVKSQAEVQQDLVKLLELLLSEDRTKRIESEKQRVREYLKRVSKLIKEQKSVQGETARGGDQRKLADKQGELADKTDELARDLKQDSGQKPQDASDEEKSPGKEKQGEPSDENDKRSDPKKSDKGPPKNQPGQDGKQGDADKDPSDQAPDKNSPEDDKENRDKKPADKDKRDKDAADKEKGAKEKDSQPKDGAQGSGDTPQNQSPPQGEPQEGESAGSEQSKSDDNPAQKRLEQAKQRMKEAQKKLDEAKRSDATDKQAEALKELEQAKADLEEILRQLREEEMSRTLAMLETRFRKMLDQQVEVYEGTKRVDKVPESERDRDDEIESGRLSRKEAQISAEAEKALVVLREEGSAVAFPEAVMAMRDDMEQVVARLAQAKVGEVTQGIETDIIAALEEMIASLQKAQKDMESKSKQGQPPPSGEEDEPPLVDTLSELKMIRALQMRVNLRTERYAKMTKTEQTDTPDLLKALKQLAAREERIHKVTRDIVVGRNR
jgi:hypothetical protein